MIHIQQNSRGQESESLELSAVHVGGGVWEEIIEEFIISRFLE